MLIAFKITAHESGFSERIAEFNQQRIQGNKFFAIIGSAGAGFQARIPFYPDLAREFAGAKVAQQRPRL